MSFSKSSIEKVLAGFGHVGQVRHLGEQTDADEVFDSLTLYGVTVKIEKDELINMLKAKQPVDEPEEWRLGIEVEEKEPDVEEEPVEEKPVEEKLDDKE